MISKEVRRSEWPSFFDTFSKQHEGWLATLEIFAGDLGAQTEAVELPFAGISLNAKARPESLVINFGRTAVDHVSYTVEQPNHIRLTQTADGADDSLEIEQQEKRKTLLRFRSPMLPEFVDGIV
jgi:Family of unknown function (DUF5335)